MKKNKIYISFTLFLPLLIYLLWPLQSDKWTIEFGTESIREKTDYLSGISKSTDQSLPNILVIVVDDLGMADLSLYGNGYPPTPNIDALGANGVVFTNAYVTSPVCSPSRAAILTGRYQQRFGFQYQMHERYLRNRMEYIGFKYVMDSYPWMPKWMDDVPDKKAMLKQGIPPSEILLPELLKAKGYKTALIGKWHLGSDESQVPCNMGFDYHFGFYASHTLYAYENTAGIHDQKIENDFTDPHIWNGQRKGPHAIYQNCKEIEVNEYLTDRFTDEVISYMNKQRSDPFFLYLSFNAPHTPLQAPTEYMVPFSHIKDPVKQTYFGMIANLDVNIGKVLNAIENFKLRENTLIFFISDNGGAEYTHTTDNGNYKGGKITNLEGGIKVPFILSWPGMVNSSIYSPMVSSMDIFQTIVEITGVELPEDRTFDGINLLPFINKEYSENPPHEYLYWQRGFSKAIRNNEWKLTINEDALDTALYHIVDDQYESEDLKLCYPEIVKTLASVHHNWSSDLPPPLWPSMVYYLYRDDNKTCYFDQ